jgi:phosphoesterase RecJ-like protein
MIQADIDAVVDLLQEAESLLVVLHTHADADSAGSALAFEAALDQSVDIAAPSSVKANARPLLELNDGELVDDPVAAEYDITIVVDAPTSDRIGSVDVLGTETSLVLIDHHSEGDLAEAADVALVDTDASATAVLVYRVLSTLTESLSAEAAVGVAAGILDDTNYLADGNGQAVEAAIDVLGDVGPHVDILMNLYEEESDFSERVATAKAVARADGYKSGETLFMITHCGSEQGAAGDALIDAGADIALVLTDRGDETWVIGRLSEREDKLSLPDDVFAQLVEEYGGEGGGHSDAGTAKLETRAVDAVADDCLEAVEQALGRTFGSLE